MPHFLAVSNVRRPNAAQSAQIRNALRAIDSDLSLVVNREQGVAACWVEGPDNYGASHMQEKRAAAVAVFRDVMPNDE